MKNLLVLLLLLPFSLFAQFDNSTSTQTDSSSLLSIFEFLTKNEIVDFTLEAEFDSILMNKKFNVYLEGMLFYEDENDVKQNIPVKVKPRGKYRRKICHFPPLRLKFEPEDLKNKGLINSNGKLKLVSHCLDDKFKAKENILREYLAYKLFELHTEKSFRVHLVKVKYKVQVKRELALNDIVYC